MSTNSSQWDYLLLETGFMSIFFALETPPPFLAVFTYRFFLFRFIFSSGAVKLTSGDKSWRNLNALRYHYETQPLPNRPAWYAHKLPEWIQRLSTLGTFIFELAVPFMAFEPDPVRLAGFFLTLFFQGLIFLTGNYGFFNLLAMVLAVPLLDDSHLQWLGGFVSVPPEPANPFLTGFITAAFAGFLLLNILQLIALFYRPYRLSLLIARLSRLGLSNPYGLFAVMTTERFEFVIEGSDDFREWKPYEFKWKPGDTRTAPRQVAPHQPRLDWQMWFAALDPTVIDPWLQHFLYRLLEGSTPVLSLLRKNPFGQYPPKHVRVVVYRYHFSDRRTRKETDNWWVREIVGKSSPFSLERK